jgi:hypothetical protein
MPVQLGKDAISCWVSYLDIYGFREMVRSAELAGRVKQLYDNLTRAEDSIRRKNRTTITFRISDNFFYIHPIKKDHREAFDECLYDIRLAIDAYIHQGFPLRGGVAFGQVAWGPQSLLGDAVSRAVSYEKLAGAPIVIVPERELILGQVARFARNTVDLEDEGNGIFSAMVVVPRRRTELRRFAESKYKRLRYEGPPRAAKQWKKFYLLLGGVIREEGEKHA